MTWFHGSQQPLTQLAAGSSITQNRGIAVAFSHRPDTVSIEDGGRVRHTGTATGFLHRVVDDVQPSDIVPHPHPVNRERWEWLTTRSMAVELLAELAPDPADVLTPHEVDEMRARAQRSGQEGSAILD